MLATNAGCGGNDVMDAHCTPSNPDIEADSDCPFQAGQGPQVKEPVCAPLSAEATQDVTWTDVFDIFKANESGNCSSPACHGVQETAANQIYRPADDPEAFYKVLTETKGSVGTPFLVPGPTAYKDSWIHCCVAGQVGGGSPMPKSSGLPTLTDIEKIRNWLRLGGKGPAIP
jgi:hypothetical protein